jgi:hypothetical protein
MVWEGKWQLEKELLLAEWSDFLRRAGLSAIIFKRGFERSTSSSVTIFKVY